MEWVEITARTVKEATDQALDELGVDEADAELQVLEEPQPGLFGRTRGKARVRARVVPRPHPPKQERRDRRRGRGRSSSSGSSSGSSTPATEAAPVEGGTEATDGSSTSEQRASGGGGGRRRRRRGGGGPRDGGAPAAPARRDESAASDQGDSVESATLTLDQHVEVVEGFVRGLVDAFGVEATIEVAEVDDETREVRVLGDDLGLLIGPRGLTLQAVHELARTVVYRAAPDGQEGRVRIDIGGYRERRRQALEQFATKVAADVVESATPKALEPMSPPDRKVVHDTINAIEGVRTTSDGEEPRRRVIVLPEDA